MRSREDIAQLLSTLLVEMFEVEPAAINPQARLYEDLDIDSIDAVDLIVELRKLTGKQINPDEFKAVRTIDDVIDTVTSVIERE